MFATSSTDPLRSATRSDRAQLFEVVTEPGDRRLALGDVLEQEPLGHQQFIGNGGTWWNTRYRIVAGPNAGRSIQFGGFVDDDAGETEWAAWPPDWLRPVPALTR